MDFLEVRFNNIFRLRLLTYGQSVSDTLVLYNVQRTFGFHSVYILCICQYYMQLVLYLIYTPPIHVLY